MSALAAVDVPKQVVVEEGRDGREAEGSWRDSYVYVRACQTYLSRDRHTHIGHHAAVEQGSYQRAGSSNHDGRASHVGDWDGSSYRTARRLCS